MPTPYDEEFIRIYIKMLKKSMLDYFTQCDKALTELETRSGFNPSQPRVPAGNSDGGEWTDGGGGKPSSGRKPKPPKTPERPGRSVGSVLNDLFGTRPAYGMTDELPGKDPFDLLDGGRSRGFSGGGGGGARGGRLSTKPRSAPQEQDHLNEARKLPENVRVTGKGVEKLTPGQLQKFKKWKKKNNNYKNQLGSEMDVTTYSDGRAIYSFKVPGKRPGSYRINEKHVAPSGETIKTYGVNILPNGKLEHIKQKGGSTTKKNHMLNYNNYRERKTPMKTRQELLRDLLLLKEPKKIHDLCEDLATYGWDSDEDLVTLTEDMTIAILQRYLSGELSEKDVEDWAWAIDDREDIAIGDQEGDNQALFFAVAELANPSTEGDLTPESARKLIADLQATKER